MSELPMMDRFEAEQSLGAAGTDGGYLLRRQAGDDEKVCISCVTKGKYEHYVMVLVERPDKSGAQWLHRSQPLPEISMLEAAVGLLNDKQVPNMQYIGESSA